ncbi:MAG: hypothetical protein ACYC1U_10460 [Candidatus Aquicultorales bacterium]
MSETVLARRIYLHRGMWNMRRNRVHVALGAVWILVVGAVIVFAAPAIWAFQAHLIGGLLAFANVPYRLVQTAPLDFTQGFPIWYKPGGPTFVIPLNYTALSPFWALLVIALLAVGGFVLYRWRRIPLPGKVFVLFFFTLLGSAVLYTTFVSPVPPTAINRLWVDWQYSGIVIPLLIAFVFAVAVFPIQGPVWIKFLWVIGAILFSFVWNTVRLAVVLSTLYHAGSIFFLVLHYMTGIFIDFIYIVAFFSLALAHLARHGVSEVGW